MRQAGVLDVGCHSALFTVARQRTDTVLEPVFTRKVRLSLHTTLDRTGRLSEYGVQSVQRAVAEAMAADRRPRRPEVFAFATSVIRDAPNRDEVIAEVDRTTGVRLRVLPGEEEARLAYVAARRWAGPGAGPLLVLDIGGGTVEIASGSAEQPRTVCSLPIGARRITRDWLPGGFAASPQQLDRVRVHLRRFLSTVPGLPQAEPGGLVLACSKTFAQLARLAGALSTPTSLGGQLTRPGVQACVPVLSGTGPAGREELPGISQHRAEQSLAGALIAEALLDACGAGQAKVCPWSTREGLLLERLGADR